MKNILIIFFTFLSLTFFNSCQKELAPPEEAPAAQHVQNLFDFDYIYENNPNINKVTTLENRNSKEELISIIVDEMLAKDKKYNFLANHTKKFGYPVWEYASFIEEGQNTPLVVVPYAKEESEQITTLLYVSFLDDEIIFEFAKPNKTKNSFKKLLKGKATWENIEVSMLSYLASDFEMFDVYHEDYAEYFFNTQENALHATNRSCSTIEVCQMIYVWYAKENTEVSNRSNGYELVCNSYNVCASEEINSGGDCMFCGGGDPPNYGGGTSPPSSSNNYYLPNSDELTFTQRLDNFASLYDLNQSQKNYLNNNQVLFNNLHDTHNQGGNPEQRAQRMFNEQQACCPIADLVKFSAESAYLKVKNPSWSKWQVQAQAWLNVKLNQTHIVLDLIGVIPGYGEPADLINGLIYSIEGDLWNATISIGSAVGIGEIAKYGKYFRIAVKHKANSVKKVLYAKIANNGSIRFVNKKGFEYTSEFGSRSNLRSNIGLASGDPREAHHLIPWNLRDHPAVQKAAKDVDLPYHLNHPKNGIPLDKFRKNLDNNGVHANHPKYNDEVERRLNLLNLNDPKLAEKVIAMQNQMRQEILDNPGIKLNDLYN